jgi:hypothetical protein
MIIARERDLQTLGGAGGRRWLPVDALEAEMDRISPADLPPRPSTPHWYRPRAFAPPDQVQPNITRRFRFAVPRSFWQASGPRHGAGSRPPRGPVRALTDGNVSRETLSG